MVYVKNIVLGIGIVIVFALVLWQGIEAFYPAPRWENLCTQQEFTPRLIKPEVSCQSPTELQQQEQQCYNQKGQPIYDYDENGCPINVKECDFCQREFEKAELRHAKIVFVISLIAGILALIIGYAILSVEPVGSALMGSAVWAIFYGSIVNWRNFSDIWRFALLFAVLVLLIWIALRLNKRSHYPRYRNLPGRGS